MQDLTDVRAAFTEPEEFWSSPLYRRLSGVVAADPLLVRLAANARPGQVPTFAFFAAVHALLLGGTAHPLAEYYPSLHGPGARPPDEDADNALRSFARQHRDSIRELLRSRLVQTNHVQRAVGLRLGFAAIATQVAGAAVHLLEIGSSAGLVLRHDQYRYVFGDHVFGHRDSAVELVTEWRSTQPVPDLDAIPPIASTTGVDLNPLDPDSPADRLWLHALVWPEDRYKDQLLGAALTLAAAHPIPTLAGDAVDVCPGWADTVPVGQPRVVFHCATRMHVPIERRSRLDQAIESIGDSGPLYHIAIEGDGLVVTDPAGAVITHYDVDGHLAWVKPT